MTRIVSLTTKNTYTIEPRKGGENAMVCPECGSQRKNQKAKSFSWNEQKELGHCHHCDATFVIYRESEKQKEYTAPVWSNKTELTDKVIKWFESRMISQATLVQMRIYSSEEFMPQIGRSTSVVCFPFLQAGKLVNVKYRDGAKNFKLSQGAKLIFYNVDGLDNQTECVIVEGEIDALSYITCGVTNVVSVPNGANSNLQYLDDCIELFDSMEVIYIATDNDPKGIQLREELIRRLGPERCKIVNFKACKDANEYLVCHGGIELKNTLQNAIDIQVDGIVNLSNHYDEINNLFLNGMEKGLSIGSDYDEACTWETGRLAAVTGIPSHGKSEWVDFLTIKLNILFGWKAAFFSPENFPIKYHYAKLASKIVGKEFKAGAISRDDFDESFEYVKKNFDFIFPEDDFTVDSILAKAKYLVKKKGIKVLVLDPYNKFDHSIKIGEPETVYISRFLDKLTTFARKNNVLVILVAHPTKMKKDLTGAFEVPSLYDINGSANFYNKVDYGVVVYRNRVVEQTFIHFLKVKFKHLGAGGVVQTTYNYRNGRYETANCQITDLDFSNYLHTSEPSNKIHSDEFFNGIETFNNEPPF